MLWKMLQFGSKLGMELYYRRDPRPAELPIKENIPYTASGLEEHKLDIIYPASKRQKYPYIINVHGGSFSMHSKDKLYRHYGMRLAKSSFAVVNINYRLAPQFTYPAQIQDMLASIQFIYEHADSLYLDNNAMFLTGDSAGAYLAAMAACIMTNPSLQESYQFHSNAACKAIALHCGLYDFTTAMEPAIIFPMKRLMIQTLFGRKDYTQAQHFSASSVFALLTSQFPPAYLMDYEKNSFHLEALRFAKLLEEHQIIHQLHLFKKEENLIHSFHIISKYPQSTIVLEETLSFFESFIEL